jgi:thymidylate synthase (FAD)
MAHCVVPAAEEILDREFRVHDKGFVRLVDYLGADERIAQAARVSYGEGTKTFRQDKALINYLLRNEHTSPFEQVILTFHVKMPIFVARQWIRHRTARLNEISGRYSVLKDEFYLPAGEDIARQSTENKQGRDPEAVDQETQAKVLGILRRGQKEAYEAYSTLLEMDIARELARVNLPVSTYTEMYWQMDLRNLFHFLELRLDRHAQKEIRDYAFVVFDLAKRVCPTACAAFEEYIGDGVSFSRKELAALRDRLAGREVGLSGKALDRFNAKLEGRKILS